MLLKAMLGLDAVTSTGEPRGGCVGSGLTPGSSLGVDVASSSGVTLAEPRLGFAAEVAPRYRSDRRPAVARSGEQRSTEAAEALNHLGRVSLRELSMESLLQSMADLTKR